jgi:thiol-disulfide isomerase/thioredoxin
MVRVEKLKQSDPWGNYRSFRELLYTCSLDIPQVFLFYGNPTEKEVSWCPPCRIVHPEFMKLAKAYNGIADVYTIPVGTEEQWKPTDLARMNPFKSFYPPMLQAVPTVLVYKRIERGKVIKVVEYLRKINPSTKFLREIFSEHVPELKQEEKGKKKVECTSKCRTGTIETNS